MNHILATEQDHASSARVFRLRIREADRRVVDHLMECDECFDDAASYCATGWRLTRLWSAAVRHYRRFVSTSL